METIKSNMRKKIFGIIILILFLESILFPISSSQDATNWWNNDWSYRQEILIPINTSSQETKFQPIDIHIEFNDSCWAIDQNSHSVRVIFQYNGGFIELDSQIYELNHSDNEHISSCNLVFLIPDKANGNESYFVYYDDEKKSGPYYTDHVNLEESSYQYEPLPGFKFESNFYKITEDGFIVYAINKKGTYLSDSASQQITKLKKGSTEVKPSNSEQVLSLSFVYWWLIGKNWYSISSVTDLVSNEIFVDGNIMVNFGIVTRSSDNLLKTTVYYKYYYCPTENKRIYSHVKHEITGYPLPLGDDIDLAFIIFPFARLKSNSIPELNFGEIPPYLHFYNEEGRIVTYKMDQYPESSEFQEMIGKQDDYDIGNQSWLSADYGETGVAQSVIFEKNNVLKSAPGELDGIELQLAEANSVKLPGLDGSFAYLYFMRNAFEGGKLLNIVLPQDYVAEFNVEFFTAETDSYKAVEKEAAIYQKLISYQPSYENETIEGGGETKEYSLTTYAHLPLTLLSKLCGIKAILKNTHLSAELFDGNNLVAFGKLSRISFTKNIKIDWKNSSIFRKIIFENLLPGKYIVKIWLENPLFGSPREFIGYDIVDVQKNTTVHVFCKHEGKIRTFVYDQNKKGIENVQISLLKQNFEIISTLTDSNGKALIKAPSGFQEKYTLNVTYKGFLIDSQSVRLGKIRRFIPIVKKFTFPVYDLAIDFKDSSKKKPTFDVNLSLTSAEMKNPIFLYPDSESNGIFYFNKLYPANYTLSIKYNQFEVKKTLQIPGINSMSIDLYDLALTLKDNWSFTPYPTLDVSLRSIDFEKNIVIMPQKLLSEDYLFSNLYPGNYTLKISYLDHLLVTQIVIPYGSNGSATIVFPAEFNTTIRIYDSRGNPLKETEVLISRSIKNETKQIQGFTDGNGEIKFSLPPASYDCQIFNDNELVAQRKIDVLNEKIYDVTTNDEPLFPNVLITIFIILIIASAFVSYKKKDVSFFLKFFAIAIVVIALFSPWWSINGSSSSQSDTSTKLFLLPTKMVTMYSSNNITAGEIDSLDQTFMFAIDLIPILVVIGLLFIVTSMLLVKFDRKRTSLVFSILTIIIFIGSFTVFTYAMSEFANTTVGSLYGNGSLEIAIPGEKMYETISCSWGPSIGFYLLFTSIIILVFTLIFVYKKSWFKKILNLNK